MPSDDSSSSRPVDRVLMDIWNHGKSLPGIMGFQAPPVDIKAIEVARWAARPAGGQLIAPVYISDLTPGTVLFLDIDIEIEGKSVNTSSRVYCNPETGLEVMGYDTGDIDVDPEDVVGDRLVDAYRDKLNEGASMLSRLIVVYLQLYHAGQTAKDRNEEE